jgi:hypothetical protein
MYEELKDYGFTIITVALDKNSDDARPWIEVASPSHPSLIDTKHLVADLYNMVNVPTILWIDEAGNIVRPNDVAFGNNQWKEAHGLDADVHKVALRDWVKNGTLPFQLDRTRELQSLPSVEHQEARAEFALGQWLWEQGRRESAEPHFVRAGELAPADFTIRRGSMPMREIDPMGPEFFKMAQEWSEAGNIYYQALPES